MIGRRSLIPCDGGIKVQTGWFKIAEKNSVLRTPKNQGSSFSSLYTGSGFAQDFFQFQTAGNVNGISKRVI